VFLDFYVAAFFKLDFTICGSYKEQVWPPLDYNMYPPPPPFTKLFTNANETTNYCCQNFFKTRV